jgi:hypothetical protein
MKIPYFKAKDKDSDRIVEGFYFEYPETTYCFSNDYEIAKCKLIPCIVTHRMTDWGLPNIPQLVTIDKSTLEKIGYIEIDNDIYIPNTYIKE